MRCRRGLAQIAVYVIAMIAIALIQAVAQYGIGCVLDVNTALGEPGERVVSSAEVIDRNAQLYNSRMDVVSNSEELQMEIHNMTIYSGMNKFPNKLAGKSPLELVVLLEAEYLDLSQYRESWNLAIADIRCMLELDCHSICLNDDCTEFEYIRQGSVRLPSIRPDQTIQDYLQETQDKLDLFMKAYQDAQKAVELKKNEVLEEQGDLKESLDEARLHITSNYNSTREILIELDKRYCSASYPIPSPEEKFYKAEATNSAFSDVINEVEAGPRYTNQYRGWLFNRIQRLTNASLSLSSRNELMSSQIIPSVKNHEELSECILKDVGEEVNDALNLAGADRSFYEGEKVFCESRLTIPRTIDSEAETSWCLVEYVIKPIKGEVLNLTILERKLELVSNLLKIALDPVDEETELFGEKLHGEDLENYLSSDDVQKQADKLEEQKAIFKNLPNLPVKEYSSAAHKIDDELDNIRYNLKILDNDAHKNKVNSIWSDASQEISRVDGRIAWLQERGVNSTVDTVPEQDYLVQNSRFRIDEISSFRAFGHMNKLRHELGELVQNLQQKRAGLNSLIASKLEPKIEFGPVQARLNQQAEITIYVEVENPFPDEEFPAKLKIATPLLSKTLDAKVGLKGYSTKLKERAIPITGSEVSQARAFNYPSNILILSKTISFTSPFKSDLEVPVGMMPYDFDCGYFECDYQKKSIIVYGLEGQGQVDLIAYKEDPLDVKFGARVGNDQILSVANKLPFEVNASVTIFTNDTNPSLIDKAYNSPVEYSYEPSTNTLTFSTVIPANSIKWIQITSSQTHTIPATSLLSPSPVTERPESNYTFDEVKALILQARENYHLAKFAANEHPKLVLVNLEFLESLISSAQSKLNHRSDDAYNSSVLALNETKNSTRSIAGVMYEGVMMAYNHIKQTEADFEKLKPDYTQPDSILLYANNSQNTTQLDLDVKELQDYYNQGDVENTILFGSQVLKSMGSMDLSKTVHYEQVEKLTGETISSAGQKDSQNLEQANNEMADGNIGNSYVKSRNSLLETPFGIPWWLPSGAVVALISVTIYVFRDRVSEVRQDFSSKIKEYEKKAEEDEMEKYNI